MRVTTARQYATIRNQRDLRQAFWREHPDLPRKKYRDGSHHVDARVAFVDYVDMLARDGMISEALAQRATLEEGK